MKILNKKDLNDKVKDIKYMEVLKKNSAVFQPEIRDALDYATTLMYQDQTWDPNEVWRIVKEMHTQGCICDECLDRVAAFLDSECR